ncbi:MAG: hypothetical protein WDN76_05075 [Alphaproteobacteria bacterium]
MTSDQRVTLEDLEKAKAALAHVEARDADYTGGNPNKHHSSLNDARRRVYELTWALKEQGEPVAAKSSSSRGRYIGGASFRC